MGTYYDREKNLLEMVCAQKEPAEAIKTAIKVIADFLGRPQSSQEQDPADPPVPS